jgi:hypothetical protein
MILKEKKEDNKLTGTCAMKKKSKKLEDDSYID